MFIEPFLISPVRSILGPFAGSCIFPSTHTRSIKINNNVATLLQFRQNCGLTRSGYACEEYFHDAGVIKKDRELRLYDSISWARRWVFASRNSLNDRYSP